MWWLEMRKGMMRKGILGASRQIRAIRGIASGAVRLVVPLVAAGLLAGCFQPLYGERSVGAGPSIRTAMSAVDVAQIPVPNGTPESRLAVNIRESLLFAMTNGTPPARPRYRLNIRMTSTRLSVVVDLTSARPEVENYGITATFQLVELETGRTVIADQTFSRVSYDIPGEAQRFARTRGLRDAETRAAEVIAESIKNRLASYFVAGT